MRPEPPAPTTPPQQLRAPARPRPCCRRRRRWLSANAEKAWAEACFLRYSLVWPILFGGWCMSGWHLLFGDVGNLAGAPPALPPATQPEARLARPPALPPVRCVGACSGTNPQLSTAAQ